MSRGIDAAMPIATPRAGKADLALLLAASVCGFLLMITVFWFGFRGSDDTLYWKGAAGWLTHFPYLGDNHWQLRHTLVIPMALTRAVLGDGMPALVLPSLLYAVGVVVVVALWVYRAAGLPAAAAAMTLVVTCPQFVLLSSDANVDVVELFFVAAGFALIHAAMAADPAPSRRRIRGLLLLAGVSLGFAMLSRETTAFAVVAIGLLFLAGYGMRRADYLIIGFGFVPVVGLEFVALRLMSGSLFYRSNIALHHDAMTNRWINQGLGVPMLHPAIDPVTMLLLNHNFGLLTWIGVPLAVWLLRRGEISLAARRLAVLALTLAAVWSFIAAALWGQLDLVPRYFLLPEVMLSLVAGIALARIWGDGRRRLAGTLMLLLLAANVLAMALDNRNFMYGEHALVDIAARVSGPIHTDPQTLRRAEVLLEWQGTADRVTEAPAGPGDLFYLNPARNKAAPGAGWTVVERHGLPATIGQIVATHLLPAKLLSASLFNLLGRGHPDVTLYRIP
jgi:4-amino-4-deoxy-L-arabinose transferase-like glycosyltransferase